MEIWLFRSEETSVRSSQQSVSNLSANLLRRMEGREFYKASVPGKIL